MSFVKEQCALHNGGSSLPNSMHLDSEDQNMGPVYLNSVVSRLHNVTPMKLKITSFVSIKYIRFTAKFGLHYILFLIEHEIDANKC